MSRIIRHEPLKRRTEYKRDYRSDGTTRSVEVERKDIENMIDKKTIWSTTKWLTEQVEHGCARYDFVTYAIATKIAKMVLTDDEIEQAESDSVGLFKTKPRELLSDSTMQHIKKYVFKCWKEYEKFNMVEFTKVKYNKTFRVSRRRSKTYTYTETAVKLTEKGKKVVV